jgi:YVTN family beta-propeller protein
LGAGIEFRILGRLEALEGDRQLALGGAKQRAVLAVLLLHRRELVSIDRLVDELWGERPPPTAAQTVRVYVSRLRKALGDRAVETVGRGYRLAVDPAQVDRDRFDALAADGRAALDAGDALAAVELLDRALELWRGPPLEEFAYEPFAQPAIAELEDARLGALEDRAEGQLRLGHGAELVPELERLVAGYPLRERLIAGLMLALYRAGRQTDALAAYRTASERLRENLGLEPGPELRELERRILEHDPALGSHRLVVVRRQRRRARTRLLAGALMFGALLAAVLAVGFTAAPGRSPRLAGGNGVVGIGAGSARLVTATTLTGAPGGITAGLGSVWVADPGANAVSEIDPSSGRVIDRIPLDSEPGSIAWGAGAVWVASSVGATVTRIDPGTEVTRAIPLPGSNPAAIAFGDGRLWVAEAVAHQLVELDPATGSVQRTLSLDFQPSAILPTARGIWVAGYGTAVVDELDPASGRALVREHVGNGPAALAFTAGSLWVANSLDGTVSRIDPSTKAVTATIAVGSSPTALAAADGSLWVADQYSGTVSEIDPRHDKVEGSVAIGADPTSLTVSTGRVWAAVAADSVSHRGGTLVMEGLVSTGPLTPVSIDPAFYSYALNPQFMGLAYDSLVTFERAAGADGLRLVPDLALYIPTPTDDGLAYTFRLRPGIRYSDGRPLRASDFRRGIERLFRVGSIGSSFYAGIVGAAACVRRPRSCALTPGIVTNDTTGTVTFRLTAPDPDFLYQLTVQAYSAPIPPGTPDHETGSQTVPATGPYEINHVSRTEIHFVRNPFFREWSQAAQPAGNPDSITWQTVRTPQDGVTAIEQGRADWWFGSIPAAQLRQLEVQNPAQLHSNPVFGVEFLPLNTNLAPFNNLKARQALNYAIDRAKIAALYGGPTRLTPTCQPIALGLPGYRRYCPYTVHPQANGAWTGPDIARARELVALSGTRGDLINVWGEPDEGYIPPAITTYVASVLRAIGYRTRVHLVPLATVTQAMRTHFQISTDGDWVAAYPSPSAYLPQFFSCGGSASNDFYCNHRLDREMQKATQLELSDPHKAANLWATIDRQLTNNAVWVPTVTASELDLTSGRLHNYEYNPVWGFLADESWLG